MNSLGTNQVEIRATSMRVSDDSLVADLTHGRTVLAPLVVRSIIMCLKPEQDLVCDAEITRGPKALRPLRHARKSNTFCNWPEHAGSNEICPINNERFVLSGVSLIGRRALLSGISSIELICSATGFSGVARGIQCACSEPSVFALLHTLGVSLKM